MYRSAEGKNADRTVLGFNKDIEVNGKRQLFDRTCPGSQWVASNGYGPL
jgi:hypothetical protein